jgi:hypothetical protein
MRIKFSHRQMSVPTDQRMFPQINERFYREKSIPTDRRVFSQTEEHSHRQKSILTDRRAFLQMKSVHTDKWKHSIKQINDACQWFLQLPKLVV